MNEILEVSEREHLIMICEKAANTYPHDINPAVYYKYLRCGIFANRILALATFSPVMTSCIVLCLGKDLYDRNIATTDFMWIDPHYPQLYKEYLNYADKLAEEKNIKVFNIITHRNEKAFERKYGKYGFSKAYTVFQKKVD